MYNIEKYRIPTQIASLFIFIIAVFMNSGMAVDTQNQTLGLVGSFIYLAFWIAILVMFRNDKKMLCFANIMWIITLATSIFYCSPSLSINLINDFYSSYPIFQLILPLLILPFISIPFSISTISYDSNFCDITSIIVTVLIPLAFLITGIVLRRKNQSTDS